MGVYEPYRGFAPLPERAAERTGLTQMTYAVRQARFSHPVRVPWVALAATLLPLAAAGHNGPRGGGCFEQLSSGHLIAQLEWRQRGSSIERREIPAAPAAQTEFVRVEVDNVDAWIELQDRTGAVLAQSDSAVERSAFQHAYLPAPAAALTLVVTSREPSGLAGTVRVTVIGLDAASRASPEHSECAAAMRQWADGDTGYAHGRAINYGRSTGEPGEARAAFTSAVQAYRAARELLTGPAHISERGELELALSEVDHYALKDWAGSASWGATAAATFAKTHEPYRRARAQAVEASARIELAGSSAAGGRTTQTPSDASEQRAMARRLLRNLSRFHAARGEEYDDAMQLNNIGRTYVAEARFALAIPYFVRAQRAFERLGDATRAAQSLENSAFCDWGLGRLSESVGKYDRALELMPATVRPHLYQMALDNSGLAHHAAGQFEESLRLQSQALDLANRLQLDLGRQRADYGLGITYYALGDPELAADFLQRGLDVSTTGADDGLLHVSILRGLAQIEYEDGHLPEAIAHDSEALRRAARPSTRSRILLHLAQDYAAQGDVQGSRSILNELVAHPPNDDALVRAKALAQLGRLDHAAGAMQLAAQDLVQGIHTLDRYDALEEGFDARVELARVYAEQGRIEPALLELHRALGSAREIRAAIANPEYRTSNVQSLRPALSLQVDLLHAKFAALAQLDGHAAADAVAGESLTAVDGDRAAGFQAWRAEYLEEHANAGLAHLLAESSSLYHGIAERRYQLTVRVDRAGTDDSRARALREDIASLRARLAVLTAEIARRSGGAAHQGRGDAGLPAVPAIQRALPPGRVAIEYWLGTSTAYAWVLRGGGIEWIELGSSEDIGRAAHALHEAMRSPDVTVAARRAACAELYRLTIAPLTHALEHVQELVFIPDGALHYVPFAALLDATRSERPYLVQSYALAVAPALRFVPKGAPASRVSAYAASGSQILLVADPVYAADDPRLGNRADAIVKTHALSTREVLRGMDGTANLERLEASAREAAQIGDIFGAARVDLLQGADATRDGFLARDLAHYRFIHIASHGLIDSEIPELSALILATHDRSGTVRDPYVRAADLLTRTFRAEAVVLSACDTALGKEYGSEGIVGLRYAALARGAQTVVASLWPVADGITARLMSGMYRELVTGGPSASPARSLPVPYALTLAMRRELDNAPQLDPALWAPFTAYVAAD
jgi:CHAT domain-containing protein/tetratricopeptide (TPR) repeat protein